MSFKWRYHSWTRLRVTVCLVHFCCIKLKWSMWPRLRQFFRNWRHYSFIIFINRRTISMWPFIHETQSSFWSPLLAYCAYLRSRKVTSAIFFSISSLRKFSSTMLQMLVRVNVCLLYRGTLKLSLKLKHHALTTTSLRKTRHQNFSLLARWPSGLRRRVKAAVRKGVGSNPTLVTLTEGDLLDFRCRNSCIQA